MNNKRLIITSLISIILVSILFVGSTYSIFTTGDIDENANVYTTGNLDVTYMVSSDNIKLMDAMPKTIDDLDSVKPYRITVNNNGNVAYKFNVILNNTTATTSIDTNYIMTQVGKLEPISLGSTVDNVIKSDIVVEANSSVDIDVKVYVRDDISNSMIGRNFSATLSIDGLAVYNNYGDIDNSVLVSNEQVLELDDLSNIRKVSGSILDNGIFHSGVMYNRTQQYVSLDGVDDYIDLGMSNRQFKDGITLVTRIRNFSVTKSFIIGNLGNSGIGVLVDDNSNLSVNLYDDVSSSYKSFNANNSLELGKWYTIVIVYDNSVIKIYIDGNLDASFSYDGIINESQFPVLVGVNNNYSQYAKIDVSNVLIYDKPLSVDDISKYYSGAISSYLDDNLLCYYRFDDNSILYD